MATVEVVVCDVCGTVGLEARPYTVEGDGRTVKVALCEDDATPLTALLSKGQRRRRTFDQHVKTVQEIEAAKVSAGQVEPQTGRQLNQPEGTP